ncbi:MAG: PQQ-dependent sugar dehydrogenase, partial [Cyclobacteriaceae bacterium]
LALLTLFAFCTSFLMGCQPPKSEETLPKEVSFATDELSIQHGLELFNQHCASCHNFETNEIGPNLSGVTSQADKKWLVSFIGNAPSMIEGGDERASQLFQKYKQIMPAFTMLEEEQIEHILGFMHKFSEGEKKKQNHRPGGLINPISAKIPMSDLTLALEELLIVPASADGPPLARINKLLSIESNQTERLFIHDLRGKLYEIKDEVTKVFLDLTVEQPNFIDNPGWGTGLGSFAFHSEFEKNGLLYTTHTEPKRTAPADFALADSIPTTLQWVLTEWKSDDPLADIYSGTHRELLRADMYSGAHGFQELAFNPLAKPGDADYGLLYFGVGDGSLALRGYPHLCNNPGKIWGSVMRIDPAGNNSDNSKYGIPEDNPFVNQPDALGEVWAFGFRNPHRISWDRTGSGKMLITNIGQHSVEELNLGVAGGNYGWPDREGTFLYDVLANPELVYPLPAEDSGYVYPVAQYDHDEGNAISGGFVYVGTKIPLLRGKYIFGDIPRGKLFYTEVDSMQLGQLAPIYELSIEINGQKADLETVTNNKRVNLRLGIDHSGELYIFTKSDGAIYKVIDCKGVAVM